MLNSGLTLNLVVSNALEAMEFYKTVFDNTQRGDIYEYPNHKNSNEANIKIDNMNIRLVDENEVYGTFPPKEEDNDSIWLQIVVSNLDASLVKALKYGAGLI